MHTTISTNRMFRSLSDTGRAGAIYTIGLVVLGSMSCWTAALADQPIQSTAVDQTESVAPKLRLRIAVDQSKTNEIRDDNSLPRDVKEGLQAMLVERLQQSGRFQIMEREATALDQSKQEDEIDQQKRDSLNDGGAAASTRPRQRRTAAQFIVTPTVTGLQETSSGHDGISFGPITMGGKKKQTTLSINIRISDAETSETIASFTAEGKIDERAQNVKIDIYGISAKSSGSKETPISRIVGLTLNDAVTKICAHLAKEPWYALVAENNSTTHRVIISAGSDSGVEVGMEFTVNQVGAIVRNPETGDVISKGDESPIGRIRIVRVEHSAAYAEVLSGDGFKVGNIVRELK